MITQVPFQSIHTYRVKNNIILIWSENSHLYVVRMNNNGSKDGIKSRKEGSKPRQRVKFEGESEEEERGSPERGVKGWLDGDYKVGDVNFAIARVTEDRQVKIRMFWVVDNAPALFVCLFVA